MLQEGETAPDFTLPGTAGEDIEPYRLYGYTDSGAVVLVFYPFDFCPICTEEACEFRDAEWLSVTPGVDVFGISSDSAFTHQRFVAEFNLMFPLLSDHRMTVCDLYDVMYTDYFGHENVPKHSVFVIDDSEQIRYTWTAVDTLENPDLEELYDAISTVTEDVRRRMDELDMVGAA